jgi:hypothetical protein
MPELCKNRLGVSYILLKDVRDILLSLSLFINVKAKRKFHPRTDHVAPEE